MELYMYGVLVRTCIDYWCPMVWSRFMVEMMSAQTCHVQFLKLENLRIGNWKNLRNNVRGQYYLRNQLEQECVLLGMQKIRWFCKIQFLYQYTLWWIRWPWVLLSLLLWFWAWKSWVTTFVVKKGAIIPCLSPDQKDTKCVLSNSIRGIQMVYFLFRILIEF